MPPRTRQAIAVVAAALVCVWLVLWAVELALWPAGASSASLLLVGRTSAPAPVVPQHDSAQPRPSDSPARLAATPPQSESPAGGGPSVRLARMRVTAYCPCRRCCGRWSRDGRTACGVKVGDLARHGGAFVAADTRLLPFGTQVRVPGYGEGRFVEVLDRGRKIRGRSLDVFFPTHSEAKRWGVQWLTVEVVEP